MKTKDLPPPKNTLVKYRNSLKVMFHSDSIIEPMSWITINVLQEENEGFWMWIFIKLKRQNEHQISWCWLWKMKILDSRKRTYGGSYCNKELVYVPYGWFEMSLRFKVYDIELFGTKWLPSVSGV
jgi:hypothetical protein